MKLYFSPGACSLSPHIALQEAGLACELTKVDLASHTTETGEDYYKINPIGAVPMLELDSGEKLTEGPVISRYIAEKAKNADLLPPAGTIPRYRVEEWQNYITSEIHKSFAPLFGSPSVDASAKAQFVEALKKKFRWVSEQLRGKRYLTGTKFTVADAYLFVVLNWAKNVGIDVSEFPELKKFMGEVASRPAVKAALQAEGLGA
jgi:glutathione S-transferase